MTRIVSWNCWSGGVIGFLPFFINLSQSCSYIGLQEVHQSLVRLPSLINPIDPGARTNPIRSNLATEVRRVLGYGWQACFKPHVRGFHDNEPDERLLFGQSSSVRLEDFYVRHVAARFIFGSFNQFNEEKTGGPPCSKVAIGHVLEHRRSGEWFVIVNVHGFWSRFGKYDLPSRFVQNAGIQQLVSELQQHTPTNAHIIVIGDLNYTSRMEALYELAHQPCFGRNGGIILNHAYEVTVTRTSAYGKLADWPEADFAVVSRSLMPLVSSFEAITDEVPSDHGILSLTLKL